MLSMKNNANQIREKFEPINLESNEAKNVCCFKCIYSQYAILVKPNYTNFVSTHYN